MRTPPPLKRTSTKKILEKQMQLLHSITIAANEAQTAESALQTCLNKICEYKKWPIGHVYFANEENPNELLPGKIWHIADMNRYSPFQSFTELITFKSGFGLPGRVHSSKNTFWIEDISQETNLPRASVAKQVGLRGCFGAPVLIEKEVVAVIEFFTNDLGKPDEGFLNMIANVGTQVGRVIERKRAEKNLLKAVEAKTLFLTNTSHEIRTPINIILGMTRFLMDTPLDSEQKKYLESVHKSSENLLYMINSILDFSKIESGKLQLESKEFNLLTLIKDSIRMFELSARDKGITIQMESVNISHPNIKGDPGKIRQIFINLISNALKFSSCGEIIIKIEKINQSLHGTGFRFEVSDYGIGIPENKKSHIFEPFTQATSSTSRKYGGTGLGLSICKALVEFMGGNIGVKSQLGLGSTFWFTLPLQEIQTLHKTKNNYSHSKKILIIDDSLLNQIVTLKTLEKLGYKYKTATSASEAFKILENESFDLILMDCLMPHLDGYQATQILRTQNNFNSLKTPIIAMTANSGSDVREKCLLAGMNDYISKPFELATFIHILEKWTNLDPEYEKKDNIIDHSILAQIDQVESTDRIKGKLIKLFLETTPKLIQNINNHAIQRNFHSLQVQAHRLKSEAAQIGAYRIVSICEDLEKTQNQIFSEKYIQSKIKNLLDEFELVKSELPKQNDLIK